MKYPVLSAAFVLASAALSHATVASAAEADIARCTDTTSYPKPSDRVVMCTEALKTPGISIETRIALLRGRGQAEVGRHNRRQRRHRDGQGARTERRQRIRPLGVAP